MTSYERLRRIRNQHQQKRVDAILREFRQEREATRGAKHFTLSDVERRIMNVRP